MRLVVTVLVAGLLSFIAPTGPAGAADPCALPTYPSAGGVYLEPLKARHTDCGTASGVAVAYVKCYVKVKPGGCDVQGWTCKDISQFLTTQMQVSVTCRKPHKKIRFAFRHDLDDLRVVARGTTTCPLPAYPSTTGSYGELKATKVSCAKATSVAAAYYSCRTKNGQTGRCVKKVKGYACREERTTLSDFYAAIVTCEKNRKKVTFSYKENF